ncbi:hypothetical protein BD289DRAFT_372797 [Coniella lustricola]|uniref:MPN domain-containing protein n=1 Tax=Coniella lustricola TaxID=2025994 RepID=A0A2T3A1U1_9PEZI|nr:hypothetical protein BD289DRAFT_372797 [Coniella lustricola]
MATSWSLPDRPMSVEEITKEANNFNYTNNISFKHWLRAADSLNRQGLAYVRDGNVPQAYLLLYRYSILVLQHLRKHPEATSPEGKTAFKALKGRIQVVLETLDKLKPHVKAAHDEWVKIHALQKSQGYSLPQDKKPSPYEQHASKDAALSWNPQVRAKLLDADDHQDLAVDLAKQEIRRRGAARKATRHAAQDEDHQLRRSTTSLDQRDASALRTRYDQDDGDDIRRNMDAVRRRLDQSEQAKRPTFSDAPPAYSNDYNYPSISKSSPYSYNTSFNEDAYNRLPSQPPARPPKPREAPFLSDDTVKPSPARPAKEPLEGLHEPSVTTPSATAPDRPPKLGSGPEKPDSRERVTFRPAAYLEDGTPIRPIFLPAGLREEFLRIASPNTRQGLEMCGILCGTAVNNALFINCLIIPQQTCTTDTCETDNEEAVIEFCEQEDLMVFGWIHTHPTQTCFMSSRDLHTQSGYQVMMAESIAIVCAPRSEPDFGIFRLTNPPGLDYILQCTQSSTFHPHGIDNLYTDARHPPGHVYHSGQMEFQVEDLRPKSKG